MGPLLEKFKKRVTVSDESVLVEFSAAVRLRNFLMHSFFIDRMEQFNSDDGRRELIAELADVKRFLEKAGRYTRAINKVLRETIDGCCPIRPSATSTGISASGRSKPWDALEEARRKAPRHSHLFDEFQIQMVAGVRGHWPRTSIKSLKT